jgi:hypothetical protein
LYKIRVLVVTSPNTISRKYLSILLHEKILSPENEEDDVCVPWEQVILLKYYYTSCSFNVLLVRKMLADS